MSLKKIPVVGPVGKKFADLVRKTGRKMRKKDVGYVFSRKELESTHGNVQRQATQVVNLLNYTKTSGSAYNAEKFPAGYHTLQLGEMVIAGQRNPAARLQDIPYDFSGKSVLDIGCNQGGMLFHLRRQIRHGVGLDFDKRLINAANKICSVNQAENLDFYVFDLERDHLPLMADLIPDAHVDIAFLLSVCMWIENWKAVIDTTKSLSSTLLFESNGKAGQQAEQLAYLNSIYTDVRLINSESDDDPLQRKRKLYLCR